MSNVTVLVDDITEYLGRTSRPMREGEAVLRAGHIVKCGLKDCEIFAYVLQSSSVQESPHTITLKLDVSPKKWVCNCTCKAGAGGACKHIVAVLLYINRYNVDKLSCTDLEQQWGKDCALANQHEYVKPVRVREYCHVNQKQNNHQQFTEEINKKCLQTLLKCKPDSAASKLISGRKQEVTSNTVDKENFPSVAPTTKVNNNQPIYAPASGMFENVIKQNNVVDYIESRYFPITDFYRKNIFISELDCKRIYCETFGQNNDKWKNARRYRITGSTCYGLYTYTKNKNPDWEKKTLGQIKSTFSGNEYTYYGSAQETNARKCYETYTNAKVLQSGLVIHPKLPWLACSPDGVTADLKTLIEIKCPVLGATKTAIDLVNSVKYLNFSDDVYSLRKKHSYYAQVQLNMFILNIDKCHFVVYSSYDNTCIIIEEMYDENFVKDMLCNLKEAYFCKMLCYFK